MLRKCSLPGSVAFHFTAIAISVRSAQQVAAAAARMLRSFAMRRHSTMPPSVGAAVGLLTRPTTAALVVNK